MLILASCSDRNNVSSGKERAGAGYPADTAYIHGILNRVKNNSFENADSALLYLKYALTRCNKVGYNSGKSEALFLTANLLYEQNKYRDALELYNQSLHLAEEQNDILLKAKCIERMASVNLATGDDHKALKLYYNALPLFEQINDKEGIAKVYNIIGLYKNSQRKFDTAEIYLAKAIQLNTEIGNTKGLIHNNGNLGYVFEKSGRFEKAEQLYKAAVALTEESGDSVNLPMLLSNLGSLYLKMGKKFDAMTYLRKSVSISEHNQDTSMLASLFADIGELYLDNRQIDSAVSFLNKSVFCAKAIDDPRTQLNAMKLLLRSDTMKNDFRNAALRFNTIGVLKDTVYARKLQHSLRASELEYENQKKSSLIELQIQDIQNSKQQKQLLFGLLLLASITVILLALVVVLRIRNNRRKQELFEENLKIKDLQIENSMQEDEINKLKISRIEEEIKIKEREQVSSALALEQKNELLSLISDKISETIRDTGSLDTSKLKEVVASIKTQLRNTSEYDLFNQKFNQLHGSFYSDLTDKHPDLTKSELKFCAYLRLNLNGNQIASIMSVTPEAIRKTRYRIRKKLNLSKTDSLEAYISSF